VLLLLLLLSPLPPSPPSPPVLLLLPPPLQLSFVCGSSRSVQRVIGFAQAQLVFTAPEEQERFQKKAAELAARSVQSTVFLCFHLGCWRWYSA
jgi:hypothetical protein